MPWRALPRIAFGICVYPFQPSSAADLPLEIGDELYIIEQGGNNGDWYRGYLVAPPSLLAGLTSIKGQTLEARVFSGIFPRCCVEIRELLGETRPREQQDESVQETQANGLSTPSESLSPTPTGAKPEGSRKTQRLDRVPSLNMRQVSKADGKRVVSRGSWRTSRSEQSHAVLPISPISTGSQHHHFSKQPAPVPMLKIGDETPMFAQEPLVDEIASCLREWHSTKLHELLLARKYSGLDKMSTLVQRLDNARRQLLHKVLTGQELASLREQTVWDLVNGNKMLSGEVIVRSPSQRGRILTADDSAVEITKLQSVMSLLDERPLPHVDEHTLHHLLVDIKTFTGQVNQPTTVAFHLCSKFPGSPLQPVSEVYAVDLSGRENPTSTNLMGKLKTLFVDLAATDIGEGAGNGSQLFLVFKVLTNEPTRNRLAALGPAAPSKENSSNAGVGGSSSQPTAVAPKSGRASRMIGKSRRKVSEVVNGASSDGRPITAETTKSETGEPRASLSAQSKVSLRDQKTVKRTIGVGVLRVDSLVKDESGHDVGVDIWAPCSIREEKDESEEGWESVLPEICLSATGRYKRLGSPNRLDIHIQGFAHPDPAQLIEKTPTLLHDIGQTRKIGFSGAPTKPRSDIYLTISSAALPRNAFLSHPKSGAVPLAATSSMANLQLTLEVRRSSGERIDNCIYPSCNSTGQTAWRTQAVERGEPWDITIRLAIAPEDVPGSHIVMSVADHPEFPFALCWMPLWTQGAFVRDGDHVLVLYKYDEYTSSMISGRGAYLGLPWSARKGDEAVMGPTAAIHLKTYLCSTKYSQDPNLLGLLKWKEQVGPMLMELLRRFVFVPEIEIVKLLSEVFDALFEILVEYAGNDEHEDLVFNALVTVLGIVHDRRFKLGPLVDQYAETSFKYPAAASSLISSCNRLFMNAADPNAARKLRSTFKVGAHLLKFIGNARHQQEQREAGIGITSRQPAFTKVVRNLFKSLESLMLNPAPILVGTKTLLVQNFNTWLPELCAMLSPKETVDIAVSFVDSCTSVQGKLILYKLVMILNFAHAEVFKLPETRNILLSNTVRWLEPYWGATESVTDQYREQVRLCCSVVAAQLTGLGQEASDYLPKLVESYRQLQTSPKERKASLSLLFPSSYPFPTRPTNMDLHFDEALVEIAAVLAELANLPGALQLDMDRTDLATFLLSALQVYLSILDHEPYPEAWLSVHIFHHKATMRSLEKLSEILVDTFLPHPDEADQFNTDLWRAFFDALLRLVSSPALALETFPEQKRRAVWKIAGDVRELGAELLHRTWESIGWETGPDERRSYGLDRMGGFQVQYVPGLVAPIVELCLSVHEGLRSVAIEILQTMIASEWTLSQDLTIIQAEMVDCLDQLFKTRKPSESMLQKLFVAELLDLFEPLSKSADDSLFLAVKELIGTIDELLDLLVAVHGAEGNGEAAQIMDTLHLMEFLRDMQKVDIYIRYVHQLGHIQASARNFAEAGLALRLHADLYDWNPGTTEPPLKEPPYPSQTSFERKEQLYFEMIKFFEQGMSWVNALEAYGELAKQYEHNMFDFAKLARTQRAMATIYESISRGERQNSRYFRVVYKGLGFPVGLRDKQFIFEGLPSDRLATFTDRIQQLYPAAQILSAGGDMDLEGQYLQIFPVSPQKDLAHPIYQRWKVPQPIREHYLLSRPSKFTMTNRRQESSGLKEATVEKTVYATSEPFPCILRRREIVSVSVVTLSPLEAAVERTSRKTSELLALEKKIADGDDSALGSLSDAIMLSVDSASESSVAQYRDFIPMPRMRDSSDFDEEEPEEIVLNPLQNALRVALIDHALAIKRCLGLYTRPAQQATKADLSKRFEMTFAPELEVVTPLAMQNGRSPSNSFHDTLTPPRVVSPQTIRPPSEQMTVAAAAIGIPEPRPSRSEKARLSLTFLRRGNVTEQRGNQAKTNGTYSNVDEETASNTSASISASRGKSRNRLSFLQHNNSTSEDLHRNNSLTSHEPPQTSASKSEVSKSERSGNSSLVDRVGSVKKRLSVLGIGKKSSKSSVKTRMEGESLQEE